MKLETWIEVKDHSIQIFFFFVGGKDRICNNIEQRKKRQTKHILHCCAHFLFNILKFFFVFILKASK